jgi:uncharacterized protein YqhQ
LKEKQEKACFRTTIGGQALIEGIMMRGPKKQAIVLRTSDGLVTKTEPIKLLKEKYPVVGWPVVRGAVNFITSMVEGVRALMFSAEHAEDDAAYEPSKLDKWIEKNIGGEKADKIIVTLAVVLGVGIAVLLFFLLPTFLAGLIGRALSSAFAKNLVEGALRIIIFLVYLRLATKAKDIRRVWMYHGAEHKAIFAYEKGLELTVENARSQPRLHPRCGTSFLFIVMFVSIVLFSLTTWPNIWVRIGLRLLLLPLVVGISYELIRWAGRYDNAFTRVISAPGKALQKLTTAEPDDGMLEVAIEALKLVLPEREGEDKW